MDKVTVRVPATTANLACGFDVLGCAYSLYNTLSFTLSENLSFSGCPEEFQNEDNLAWIAFRAVYDAQGEAPPFVHIDISADVPVCRGLGSSAALLCAGAAAANALGGFGLDKAELLAIVTPIEGHPDNLAPALFGGMVASLLYEGKVYYSAIEVNPSLRFAVCSPDYVLSTHESRSVLPKEVPFKDAIFNMSRVALLPRAFAEADRAMLSLCLDDKLHQPYRRRLIPGMDEIEAMAKDLGCIATCISGAGPSLLCLNDDAAIASKLQQAVKALPHNWQVRDLAVDFEGTVIV